MTVRCAEWCGHGCTEEEFQKATAMAAALAFRLNATTQLKWLPVVHENIGWHFSSVSECGRLSVTTRYGLKDPEGATAFLHEVGGSGGRWCERGDTPAEAVAKTIDVAKADFAEISAILEGL